jgi:ribose/xylose/arabinose/galactoside ABC-type transport system permease subunit
MRFEKEKVSMKAAARERQTVGGFLSKQNGALLVLIVLWVLAMVFIPPFRKGTNQLTLIRQSAIPVIAAIGMMFVLITGGIDLSIGYTVGFVSAMVGIFLADNRFMYPVWFSVVLGLLIGICFGTINGLLVSKIKIPSFITTLGMGYVIFGWINVITDGNTTNKLPAPFIALGKTMILGLPSMVYIAAAVIIISFLALNKTTFGRELFSCGLNQKTSYLSGVNVNRTVMISYIINGFSGALGGILLTIRVNVGQPDMGGSTYIFEAVTAAVIGGTSLFGGYGTVSGCIFGVLIVKVIENCITILNITPYVYKAVLGIVILGALIFDTVRKKSI